MKTVLGATLFLLDGKRVHPEFDKDINCKLQPNTQAIRGRPVEY